MSSVENVDESDQRATKPCRNCSGGRSAPFPFSMAFQPIVDLEDRRVVAYEALVRGPAGEGASTVLTHVTPDNRYAFDQSCRRRAIELAAGLELGLGGARLSINFIPGAMYEPENCVQATLAAARRFHLPLDRLMFELTENEKVQDVPHLRRILDVYKRHGFVTALDDFGAGYAGLNLLAEFQPDLIKLDMALVRDVDRHAARRCIIAGVLQMTRDLGIGVIAEGVESPGEVAALRDMGVRCFQGYLFARPGFEELPAVTF
ncbi:EAL domain-containing protein [Roseomonas sp. BN140053]|uniref:EAL domain-containing protein n=1 Tax=Roseomonas sp. BN140053 TaxID=3391898 RepID=UPI0039E920F2